MTEQEWLTGIDPLPMVRFLRGKLGERKFRLFVCGCCRFMDRRGNVSGLEVVELGERMADGLVSYSDASLKEALVRRLYVDGWAVVHSPYGAALRCSQESRLWRGLHRSDLLRCITGNPFSPARIDPSWLAWDAGTVRNLAWGVYEERAFERLPILGDALEEAGCTDGAVLDHCRRPGPHARGCWVVDQILGKE
jgi:hypothetical protein